MINHDANPNPMNKLNQLIAGIKVAMITSRGDGDHLVSRPLATQDQESDGDLWFFISRNSPLAGGIAEHHGVNVAYADHATPRYVSISGSATLVDNRARCRELWQPHYKTWFPRGVEDADLALLKVRIEHADYWQGPEQPSYRVVSFNRLDHAGAVKQLRVHGSMDIAH
jgi:general stress protein 26